MENLNEKFTLFTSRHLDSKISRVYYTSIGQVTHASTGKFYRKVEQASLIVRFVAQSSLQRSPLSFAATPFSFEKSLPSSEAITSTIAVALNIVAHIAAPFIESTLQPGIALTLLFYRCRTIKLACSTLR